MRGHAPTHENDKARAPLLQFRRDTGRAGDPRAAYPITGGVGCERAGLWLDRDGRAAISVAQDTPSGRTRTAAQTSSATSASASVHQSTSAAGLTAPAYRTAGSTTTVIQN